MRTIPASTTFFAAAAAATSPLLGPALVSGSLRPDTDIKRLQNLKPDGAIPQPAALTGHHQVSHGEGEGEGEGEGAEGTPQVIVYESTLVREPQGDGRVPAATESTLPLNGGSELQPELKRSEGGGDGAGAVLLGRETSAAPKVLGVSIWLILAWLALLYLMYKTGSMF